MKKNDYIRFCSIKFRAGAFMRRFYWRRARKERKMRDIDVEEAVMADWEKEEIERALNSLTKEERYLVYKVIGKKYPLTSVAIDLNMTRGKAMRALKRAKNKLKKEMKCV